MTLAFDHPALLWLLPLAVLPLLGFGARWSPLASLIDAPADGASRTLDVLLRLLAAAPVALLLLGLAGLHARSRTVTKMGEGAHIVIVLDRSLSMHEPFALKGEKAAETKTQAAARMIAEFFARRPHDEFGIVGFSTSPIVSMPLTEHRDAVNAAIGAMRFGQLGDTDIGSGICMALAMFEHDTPEAPHVILLVTDGAGEIPEQIRIYMRNEVQRVNAHLYYLYLRAGEDPPLDNGIANDMDMTHPAALDGFFHTLNIPYQAFEAHDAGAIAAATARIGALETHPVAYTETEPRQDFAGACFAAAAICLALSVLAQAAERDVRAARRRLA